MPNFSAGESRVAKVTMRNPTGKAFDYSGFLYMGTDLAVMSEVSFHLNAGEEKQVAFPVTMPLVEGVYPVHIGVFSSGQNIALYRATEDVVILALAALSYASDVRTTYGVDDRGKPWFDIEIDVVNTGGSPGSCSPVAKLRTSHGIVEISMGTQEVAPGTIATFHGYWKWTWSAPDENDWLERISVRSEAGLKSWYFGSLVQVSAFSVPPEIAAGGQYNWSLSLFLTYYSRHGYVVGLRVNALSIFGARIGAPDWTFYTKDYVMTASGVFTFTGSATAPATPGEYGILIRVDRIDNVGNAQYAFYDDPVGKLKVT
jgi:hypothetical protein